MRKQLLVVFLIGFLTLLLITGSLIVVSAQGSSPQPVLVDTTDLEALSQVQTTPGVQPIPTPSATAVPAATPTTLPELPGELTDTLSDLDRQTVFNLIISFVAVALIAVFGGRLIYTLLRRLTRRTPTELDNLILEAVRPLIGWLIAAIGFQVATSRLDFLSETAAEVLESVYFILYLFVAVSATWRVGDAAVDYYIARRKDELNENLVNQIVPLLKRLSHIALVVIMGIILAGHFGINVLSISAALGLTGFAVALAAQDTIANIISGLVIMVDGPFKVGDRIDIAGLDAWGDVTEIGIRSSKVLTRDNRLVIVPNSAIVDSAVVNYSLPDASYRLQSDIGIGNSMDIPKVQGLINKTVRELEGVLPDKPVDVWFTEFGESSMTFRVRWWVQSYSEKRRMTDQINAAIQELALREDIEMPNPIYTLENRIELSDQDVQKIAAAIKKLEEEN